MAEPVIRILDRTLALLEREIANAESSGDRFALNVAKAAKVRVGRLLDKLNLMRPPVMEPHQKKQGPGNASRTSAHAFPRFEIRQGALVRIGWSKKYGRQYVHRVSKEAFKATLDALEALERRATGAVLPEQIILKIRQRHDENITAREIYNTLNMLLEAGAIVQDQAGALHIPENVIAVAWQSVAKTA